MRKTRWCTFLAHGAISTVFQTYTAMETHRSIPSTAHDVVATYTEYPVLKYEFILSL